MFSEEILSLARAVLHDPKILLLDEPFSNVDIDSAREVVRLLSSMRDGGKTGADIEAATAVGKLVAERAVKNGVKEVIFDRGQYLYHGRVKALADAAREGGLSF